MVYVADPALAAPYYVKVFGLRELWKDESTIGLGMSETDAEIVLHCDASIPAKVVVHYLVDDVVDAVKRLEQQGCRVLVKPFEIVIGQCAVIEDPFNVQLCLLDMTKGPRRPLQ